MEADWRANVAQLVEQLIRNQQVSGSSPLIGSSSVKLHPGSQTAYVVCELFYTQKQASNS